MISCNFFYCFLSVRGMSIPYAKAELQQGHSCPCSLVCPHLLCRCPCSPNIRPSSCMFPTILVPNTAQTIKAELTAHNNKTSYLFVPRHHLCDILQKCGAKVTICPFSMLGKYKTWVCIYLFWSNLGHNWKFSWFPCQASTKYECAFTWFDRFGSKSANFPVLPVRQVQNLSVLFAFMSCMKSAAFCKRNNNTYFSQHFGTFDTCNTITTMPIFNEIWNIYLSIQYITAQFCHTNHSNDTTLPCCNLEQF